MLPSHFPTPDLFVSGTGEPPLRWGVLAPGRIAAAFTSALHQHTTQRAVAVASRSADRAQAFASRFGIDRAYGDYSRLVADPGVDVVYVASPASEHLVLGLLALEAGKHVLIEKPLATNATDARTLIEAARTAGVLLMEAMWDRYLPQTAVIRTLLADGVFGEIRSVFADLSMKLPADPGHRVQRPDLGGGALLDLGIYPVQFDSLVLGTPESIQTTGAITASGVDASSTIVARHADGTQGTLITSLLARSPSRAHISGTAAHLELAGPFHIPTSMTLSEPDMLAEPLAWSDTTGRSLYDGLSWEATALARFVGEGRTESPLHTLDETAAILATIDEARRQLGLGR